ncbi:hypothetical protein SAMN05192554_10875 [Haloarchaeobius iranensis]|uniref:Uncharacterized protein n=1 Tax=Haloarchaeobius iranensis TaxID=996166 RepID=A0A1G9WHX2_9EURY|nr:hypothetical protein SAMN05192554_10875 [Haloarchaeobius iranensis]
MVSGLAEVPLRLSKPLSLLVGRGSVGEIFGFVLHLVDECLELRLGGDGRLVFRHRQQ